KRSSTPTCSTARIASASPWRASVSGRGRSASRGGRRRPRSTARGKGPHDQRSRRAIGTSRTMTSVGDVASEKRVPSTEAAASPDVVVVGNLTIDDVVLPDGATSMGTVGGNAVWAALGARLWDPSVGIVTRCGDDFPTAALDELRSLGIVLDGVVSVDGPTIRNWVVYERDGTRRWLHR